MPKLNSKLSRKLANVKEQLKKGTTRGRCPRPLTPQEIQNLEARRKELQEAMVKARLKDREDPVIAAPASPLPESGNDGGEQSGRGGRRGRHTCCSPLCNYAKWCSAKVKFPAKAYGRRWSGKLAWTCRLPEHRCYLGQEGSWSWQSKRG